MDQIFVLKMAIAGLNKSHIYLRVLYNNLLLSDLSYDLASYKGQLAQQIQYYKIDCKRFSDPSLGTFQGCLSIRKDTLGLI